MKNRIIFRFATLALLSLFIFACGRQDSADGGASLSIALGGHSQHLAVQGNAADSGGKLPDSVDRVRIRIADSNDREIATGDLPSDGSGLKLKVPANLALVVTGSALSGEEVLYEGDSQVSPLRPGAAQHVALTLFPFGTLTTRVVRSTLEADISENNELADSVVSGEIYSQIGFSADNHRLVFDSPAGNLSGGDANGHSDVFVKDLVTGKISNMHSDSQGVLGDDDLLSATADAAVNQVVFASLAGNLVADDHNGLADVFLKDVASGAITRLSVRSDGGELNQNSDSPTIADDGKTIAYVTDTDGDYVMLLQKNAGSYIRQSVGAGRLPRLSGDGNSLIYRGTDNHSLWLYEVAGGEKQRLLDYPAVDDALHIDYDGNLIVFATDKSFTADDNNDLSDIYLLNRANQTVKWISTDRDGHGLSGGAGATSPSLDAAGRYVSFNYNDTVYVKDADNGELGVVAQPGRDSYISRNGHLIAYHGDNGHVYVAPNPLFLQTPPAGEPTAPPENGLVGYALNVSHEGDGGGSVNSSDGGIQCGSLCSHTYAENSVVTLAAEADAASTFAGWSGDCAGTGATVQVTMSQVRSCSAAFQARNVVLRLTLSSSKLQGDSIKIYDGESVLNTCGGTGATSPVTCLETVGRGHLLTLVPSLGGNNNLITWTGCNTDYGLNGCDVVMDGAREISATVGAGKFNLSISKTGNGTITDNAGQISCGGDCAGDYVNGSQITLHAVPDAGYRFGQWGGACSGTAPDASVTMDAKKTCSATFVRQFTLNVTVNGSGSITSTPAGINCPGDCSQVLDGGTAVTLSATPGTGQNLSGWSNNCAGGKLTLNADTTCTATFAPKKFTLSVATNGGNGSGSITYGNGLINCANNTGTCSADLDYGTKVTLTATPDANSALTGWSGNCDAGGSTTIDGAKACTAIFTLKTYALTVSTTGGNGGGSVGGTPGGIDCGVANQGSCSDVFNSGSVVKLTATAAANSNFTGWSGACAGTAASVSVTVNAAKNCTAAFTLKIYKLSVATNGGTGGGTVTSAPAGINCGSGCAADFNAGQLVKLTATANADSDFTGWSGNCSATGEVTMDAAKSCTAIFLLKGYTLTVSSNGGNGGGSVTAAPAGTACTQGSGTWSCKYDINTLVTLTAAADARSDFSGWSGQCDAQGKVTITGNMSCTAIFTLKKYALTVSTAPNGGGTVSSGTGGINCGTTCSATFNDGDSVSLTATAATGYNFTNWSGNCSGTAATTTVVMSSAKTCTANFAIKTVAVTITKSGNGAGTLTGAGTYNYGSSTSLSAVASTGSTFTGWGGDCSASGTTSPITFNSLTTNLNCTATFVLNTYTVSITPQGNGKGTLSGAGTYDYGSSASLGAVADVGSTFTGWSGTNCSLSGTTTSPATLTITGSVDCTATFTLNTHTVTITKAGNGAGTVTGAGTYNYGASASLSAVASTGSTFTGWSGTNCSLSGTTTSPAPLTITGNVDCTANFTLNTYTVAITKAGNGTGTVGGAGTYDYGSSVSLSATADPSSTFTGWSGTNCSLSGTTTSPATVTITGSISCTATFTLKTYTLTTGVTGSGTVTSDIGGINCGTACSATFNHGDIVNLTATAAAGFVFTGWSSNTKTAACTGTTSPLSLTMTADSNCAANFTAVYTLTVVLAGNGSGTVGSKPAGITCGADCTEPYLSGQVVTLLPQADANSVFSNVDGGCILSTTGLQVTMSSDQTCYVVFTLKTYTMTVANGGKGTGTVTSRDGQILCDPKCTTTNPATGTYNFGTAVTLDAVADAGSQFTGWGGDCLNADGSRNMTNPLTFNDNVSRFCLAGFDPFYPTLSISLLGNGAGNVQDSSAGAAPLIDCGLTGTLCSTSPIYGTSIVLYVRAYQPGTASGTFTTADCDSVDANGGCHLTLTANRTVRVTFTIAIDSADVCNLAILPPFQAYTPLAAVLYSIIDSSKPVQTVVSGFGTDGKTAALGADILNQYQVTSRCVIGAGTNSPMQYYLNAKSVPTGAYTGTAGVEDCIAFNVKGLAVALSGKNWIVTDGLSIMENFGAAEDLARIAHATIVAHGFTNQCFVGRPGAPLEYYRR